VRDSLTGTEREVGLVGLAACDEQMTVAVVCQQAGHGILAPHPVCGAVRQGDPAAPFVGVGVYDAVAALAKFVQGCLPTCRAPDIWVIKTFDTYRGYENRAAAMIASGLLRSAWRAHFSSDDVRSSLESTIRQEIVLWPSAQACDCGYIQISCIVAVSFERSTTALIRAVQPGSA